MHNGTQRRNGVDITCRIVPRAYIYRGWHSYDGEHGEEYSRRPSYGSYFEKVQAKVNFRRKHRKLYKAGSLDERKEDRDGE